MQPDPSDIDAGLAQSKDSKQANQMIQELDGRGKYLQGISVPQSSQAPGLKPKNLNQQFDQKNVDIPPQGSNTSGIKSSNHEVVDELYASMNDFDKKLETINRLW